jgi:hypothetical protein
MVEEGGPAPDFELTTDTGDRAYPEDDSKVTIQQ